SFKSARAKLPSMLRRFQFTPLRRRQDDAAPASPSSCAAPSQKLLRNKKCRRFSRGAQNGNRTPFKMLSLLQCAPHCPAAKPAGFPLPSVCTSEPMAKTDSPTTIKKYANRRLYNTGTSTYVTLEDLAAMVKAGEDFLVYDAK